MKVFNGSWQRAHIGKNLPLGDRDEDGNRDRIKAAAVVSFFAFFVLGGGEEERKLFLVLLRFGLELSGHFFEAPVSFYNVQRYALGRCVLDLVVVVFLAGRNDWNWVRF